MVASRLASKWFGVGLILLSLVLSFAATLDASRFESTHYNTASYRRAPADTPSAAPAPEQLPPIVHAPFDWFNGLSARNQRLVTIILCVLMMLTGIFFVIFGYRIFRISLALVGFVTIFVLLWVVLTVHAPKLKWWAILLISLACALVVAVLCMFIYQIGIALLGWALGFTIATLILSTPLGTKVMTNYWAHFSIILVFSLAFSVLAVIFQRLVIIIGTSSLGAYLFCNAIDIAWMHTGILSNILVHFFTKSHPDAFPKINTWQAYVLLGGDLALFLFGVLVQFGITARNFDHTKLQKGRKGDDEREGLLVNAFYQD
jgi:hypothetical protein